MKTVYRIGLAALLLAVVLCPVQAADILIPGGNTIGLSLQTDGVAVVDPEKCISCGQCVAACPQHIIALRPDNAAVEVRCSSREFGKAVKAVCTAGCIGCGLCEKVCPHGAIRVTDHLAHVDHALCTGCGACVEKCPVGIIRVLAKGGCPPADGD